MGRARYGIGTHPIYDDPHDTHHSQNDLSVGRTLKHAICHLDSILRRRPKHYASAWLAEAADINLDIQARCHRDGHWALTCGMACDGQLEERRRRWSALFEHLNNVEGAYNEVMRICRHRGRYSDDRDIDTRTLVATVRAFLVTGGELLIRPDPQYGPEFKADTNLLYPPNSAPRPDPDLREQHFMSSREAYALERRWRAHRRIKRIGKLLGQRLDNGWHVLKAKAPAQQVPA